MNAPVKYGLYYFLTSSGFTLLLYYIDKALLFNTLLMILLSLGLAVLFVVLSVKFTRDEEGNTSFAEVLKAGLITYGIGSFLNIMFTFVLFNYIDPTLIDASIEYAREIAEKTANTIAGFANMPEEERERMREEIAKTEFPNQYTFLKSILNWVFGMIFPGGIIAVIVAAIMKKN